MEQSLHWEASKKKVKVTLVQALRLCTGPTAHTGSRCIALLFHDHGTRRWGVSVTPRPLFTPWKDAVPIAQKAGWTPGPVWTGAENLASTGIRSPNRPARSQSLYRLSYPAHEKLVGCQKFQKIPAFDWTRRFIAVLTATPLFVSILCQICPVHTVASCFLKTHLIVYSHLRVGLPSGLFLSSFPTV